MCSPFANRRLVYKLNPLAYLDFLLSANSVTIVFFSHSPPVLPKDFEFLCGAEQVNCSLLYCIMCCMHGRTYWHLIPITQNSSFICILLCYWLLMCCSGVCLVVMWPRLSWCIRVWQRWRPRCWWFRGLRNPSVQEPNLIYTRLSVDYSAAIHVSWLMVRQRPLYSSDATSHRVIFAFIYTFFM